MGKKELLLSLLDKKKILVLKALYGAKEEIYLREVAKKSGVAVSSVFRIMRELKGRGLVKERERGRMKFYGLVEGEEGGRLGEWLKEERPLDLFVEEVKRLEGMKKVLLQGKAEEGRGSLILIGERVDEKKVEEVCRRVREKGLDLSYVILTEEQLGKLEKMGLYGGEKKELG